MVDRHWIELFKIMGQKTLDKFNLNDLIGLKVMDYRDKIEEISNRASAETLIQ